MRLTMSAAVRLLELGTNGSPKCESSEARVPTDVIDTTILCPCCASRHGGRRATLNLNYEKNVFNCIRCHFSGKPEDLVAYYTGWEKQSVTERVERGELGNVEMVAAESEEVAESVVRDLAPLSRRNEVYLAMCEKLELSDNHRAQLIQRGLTEEEIAKRGYKSTPVFVSRRVIPQHLENMGLVLNNIPGFGLNSQGNWELAKTVSGFFVPGRNANHLVQGFQIRADHPCYSIPKYGYFSSRRMSGGAACGTWPHWAGPNMTKWTSNKKFDVFLTEGWLKGDICNFKTGENFLCVPGVSALKKLFPALESFRNKGFLRDVYIAYDMDAYENQDVAKQLIGLLYRLRELGYNVSILQWDREFKGLDDYLISDIRQDQQINCTSVF